MAINWQYIKGTSGIGTTYINFQGGDTVTEAILPQIVYKSSGGVDTNFGHILTSNYGQTVQKYMIFNEGIAVGSDKAAISWNTNYFKYRSSTGTHKFRDNDNDLVIFSSNAATFLTAVQMNETLNVTKEITTSSSCTASFFNSTSDRRVKENIKEIKDFKALDFIKDLKLYTFNYIYDTTRSIGLIAQEVKDIDIDGFELVENKNATGENGDFMKVRESKLVYILTKAVQELEKEVAELKAQLEQK